MAITAYTGKPGHGKSYSAVEQEILVGVKQGRRVLTNIEGIDPEKVLAYVAAQPKVDASKLGHVVTFRDIEAREPGFWPRDGEAAENFVVQPGDLVVFDEWARSFQRRGRQENPDLEPFLRIHRHCVDDKGQSLDVVIVTQLITDIHENYRGLVERSYKFKKHTALGSPKSFRWDAYEGHTQPKGGGYKDGLVVFKKEVFDLYHSYKGGGGIETTTSSRTSIWGPKVYGLIALVVVLFGFGGWGVWGFFHQVEEPPAASLAVPQAGTVAAPAVAKVDRSLWIAGSVTGDNGIRVVVLDEQGVMRYMPPDDFRFEDNRPVSGYVDGRRVVAEDRADLFGSAPTMLPGVGL